ncbi:hypothetical protein ACFR9U_01985 [Halorientalis brevis]|uniref:Histidine kinase n=1 Tax=Halorientalis brevis TaxID=1126241 RepID=A0ABD6C7I7_9EURY|nr:hypothetical protein [Halorientalis brevis]
MPNQWILAGRYLWHLFVGKPTRSRTAFLVGAVCLTVVVMIFGRIVLPAAWFQFHPEAVILISIVVGVIAGWGRYGLGTGFIGTAIFVSGFYLWYLPTANTFPQSTVGSVSLHTAGVICTLSTITGSIGYFVGAGEYRPVTEDLNA